MNDLPAWVARYVGVPFRDHGRDLTGWDCWGLLYVVLREEFGITVPSYSETYPTAHELPRVGAVMQTELPRTPWRRIPRAEARLGDGLLLRLAGYPVHVGLFLCGERFLHAHPNAGTVVDRLDSPLWARRLLGVYRYTP